MSQRKWLAVLSLTAIAVAWPSYCHNVRREPQNPEREVATLARAAAQLPWSLDPSISLSEVGNAIINAMYDGLVDINSHGRTIPCIATDWKVTGNLKYTFSIRKGIRFHDGTELTPELIVRSLQRSLLKQTIPHAILPEIRELSHDSDSVTILLMRETNLLPLLAAPPMRIALLLGNGMYVGSGRYRDPARETLNGYSTISMRRNESYHSQNKGSRILKFVEVPESDLGAAFAKGYIDETSLYPAYSGPTFTDTHELYNDSHDTWVFGINAKGILKSRSDRYLVSQCLPYEKFRELFASTHRPSTGFIPPGIAGHTPTIHPLRETVVANRTILGDIQMLIPSELLNSDKIAILLTEKLRTISNGHCIAIPFEALLDRMKKENYDIALFSMTLDYPLDEYFAYVFDKSSEWKPGILDSPVLSGIVERVRRSSGEVLSKELLSLNKLLREEYLILDLSYPSQRTILRKNIRNWVVGWGGPAYVNYDSVRAIE